MDPIQLPDNPLVNMVRSIFDKQGVRYTSKTFVTVFLGAMNAQQN